MMFCFTLLAERLQNRALVAQWIEHLPPKERVTRSIRVGGTTPQKDLDDSFHRLARRLI
jgi:hypothetical protein